MEVFVVVVAVVAVVVVVVVVEVVVVVSLVFVETNWKILSHKLSAEFSPRSNKKFTNNFRFA